MHLGNPQKCHFWLRKISLILYDISGQAPRNAFRESPEMSFLEKKNYQRNVTSGEEISRNVISCKDFFIYLRWVLCGWNLIVGYDIPFLLSEIMKFVPICI